MHSVVEHLLTILAEEGCEVAHDCHKTIRFGLEDVNILEPTGPTNQERILIETNQLIAVAEMCAARGILPQDWMTSERAIQIRREKKEKVLKFMEYSRQRGALEKAP